MKKKNNGNVSIVSELELGRNWSGVVILRKTGIRLKVNHGKVTKRVIKLAGKCNRIKKIEETYLVSHKRSFSGGTKIAQ